MSFEFEQDEIYCKLVKLVLNSEGGYVDDPDDPGGPTKYGIATNSNSEALKALGVQVRDLTYDQAKQIYYRKYYLASCSEQIARRSIRLAYLHFDTAVNMGVGRAAIFFRQVFPGKSFFSFEGAGKNAKFWQTKFDQYFEHRMAFYKQIKKGGGWKKYGKGWTNRMNRIREQCKAMAY